MRRVDAEIMLMAPCSGTAVLQQVQAEHILTDSCSSHCDFKVLHSCCLCAALRCSEICTPTAKNRAPTLAAALLLHSLTITLTFLLYMLVRATANAQTRCVAAAGRSSA
jgi:hypothetical protein